MNKKVLILLAVLTLFGVASSCSDPNTQQTAVEVVQTEQTDAQVIQNIQNVGHMYYIPVNQRGTAESNIMLLFEVVDEWEQTHADLQVVDVDFLWAPKTTSKGDFTYGVVIYARP